MALIHRVGLGRNLTAAEVDANFDFVSAEAAAAQSDADAAAALAATKATSAQGAKADSALQPADINAATTKATPVDADTLTIIDSAASSAIKRVTWANIKATAKSYFDTLYQAVLTSGTNIKTINGSSVLGAGDLTVSASASGSSGDYQINNAGALGAGYLSQASNVVTQKNGANAQKYRLQRNETGANYSYTEAGQHATAGYYLNSVNAGTDAAPTNLLALQLNGTSKLVVSANGQLASGALAGQTTPAFCFVGNTNTGMYEWSSAPAFTVGGVIAYSFTATRLNTAAMVVFGSATSAGDIGIGKNATGVAEINSGTAGTFRDLKLRDLIATGSITGTEITAPSAPAANGYTIYAEDNGSGKTRLMVKFATGAAQQLAIEP